jgi:hypothetical protein
MAGQVVIYCSVPLALLIGVATLIVSRKDAYEGSLIKGVLMSTIIGVAYSYIIARFVLNVPAFVVVIFLCWIPSSISGTLAAFSKKHLSTAAGLTILCLSTIVLMRPIFNTVAHNQQLTVAFLTPVQVSTAQLEARPETLGFANDEEVQAEKNEVLSRVRSFGYTDGFRVLSITRQGEGSKSLAVVVVRAAIEKEVLLPVPDSTTVVYVQQSNDWEKKPTQIPVLERGIKLRPPGNIERSRGFFDIPRATGLGYAGEIRQRPDVPSH